MHEVWNRNGKILIYDQNVPEEFSHTHCFIVY